MSVELRIGSTEFELALGLAPESLDSRTRGLLQATSLLYSTIDDADQTALREEIASEIDRGFTVVGEHRANIWRDAWQDHLDAFVASGHALETLNPKFVGGTTILRWQGDYVKSVTDRFELAFLEIFRDWLFRTYLPDASELYEFGSGSAFNVAAYAKLYPKTKIMALDWAPAAVQIANLLKRHHGMKIDGQRFDFFSPDESLKIASDGTVLTMCALEQIGERFGPFLSYLLANGPRRVVHVEPTLELYNPDLPHDQLAIRYHVQRNYLSGLLPFLQKLEKEGRIRIPLVRRLRFGSRFHECFTTIVWEPR